MHEIPDDLPTDKAARYAALAEQAAALMDGERDAVANAANLAALLWHALSAIAEGRPLGTIDYRDFKFD